MSEPAARLAAVRKRYRDVIALNGLNLEVRRGEVLGLLGPNGSGKTTTISILAGTRRADAGQVSVLGSRPGSMVVRRRIGVTPQEHGFPDGLKAGEVLDLVRAHYPRPFDADHLLAAFDLGDLTGRMANRLSGGQARRLAVALAFAGDPELVLLDEPSTGLDVQGRRRLWDRVRDLVAGGDKTVLLTSHYMDEIEALADRVVVLLGGRVVDEGTVADIKQRVRHKVVSFAANTAPEVTSGVTSYEFRDGRHHLFTDDADALVIQLITTGTPFEDLRVTGASLEQAFLDITRADT
jgi:ABC-2 type transport system ATP-binding protein